MIVVALIAVTADGCGGGSSSPNPTTTPASSVVGRVEPTVTVPRGAPPKHLVIENLIEGSGKPVKLGDELTVEYIGVFYNGAKFTNSWERAKPFKFRLGDKDAFVDPSWEKGLRGMRVGGRRELLVPPAARGAPPGTSPRETIVYVIDLMAVE